MTYYFRMIITCKIECMTLFFYFDRVEISNKNFTEARINAPNPYLFILLVNEYHTFFPKEELRSQATVFELSVICSKSAWWVVQQCNMLLRKEIEKLLVCVLFLISSSKRNIHCHHPPLAPPNIFKPVDCQSIYIKSPPNSPFLFYKLDLNLNILIRQEVG